MRASFAAWAGRFLAGRAVPALHRFSETRALYRSARRLGVGVTQHRQQCVNGVFSAYPRHVRGCFQPHAGPIQIKCLVMPTLQNMATFNLTTLPMPHVSNEPSRTALVLPVHGSGPALLKGKFSEPPHKPVA